MVQLQRVQQRLQDRKITLKVTDSAVQLLAELEYDPNYGAWPVKQVIMWFVENEIAQGLLKDGFKEGDVIVVDTDGTKQLTFQESEGPGDSTTARDSDAVAHSVKWSVEPLFIPQKVWGTIGATYLCAVQLEDCTFAWDILRAHLLQKLRRQSVT